MERETKLKHVPLRDLFWCFCQGVAKMKILIIGAGEISREYIKALRPLGVRDISVLSRSPDSSKAVQRQYPFVESFSGGEKTLRKIVDDYEAFIVAVPIEYLLAYLYLLAEYGKQLVLIEKPVALQSTDLELFLHQHPRVEAVVGLNRLYFPSILTLRRQLQKEGITSAQFSFTEWIHRIDSNKYDSEVLRLWGVSNCIHVISTVFSIIGSPKEMSSFVSGRDVISWHPSGSSFTGSGISQAGVPFSYHSDWRSAGRWSMTFYTPEGCYQLSPMEELRFCKKGSVTFETIVPLYQGEVKCGFAEMLRRWINQQHDNDLVTLPDLLLYLRTIERIFHYV